MFKKLFKKRVKRSKWLEGLLDMERLVKEGYVRFPREFKDKESQVWVKSHPKGASTRYFLYPKNRLEWKGRMDYLAYRKRMEEDYDL